MESKLPNLGVSIFSQMSALANQYNAINLSQGFPEFDAPKFLKDKLNYFSNKGHNQYSPSSGIPALQNQISTLIERKYGLSIAPEESVTVTSGATEALYVAIQALVKQGDEIIVFDPVYDSYEPAIELAGGTAIHIALTTPDYRINWQQVIDAITPNTKAIIVNTPHNPTTKTLSSKDVQTLKEILVTHDIYLISDEVYEHIYFDDKPHIGALSDPAIFARSFVVSSFGKTFHCTGWKLGYCVAPASLMQEFRKIHQYVTFSSFTPAQLAIAEMMECHAEHIDELKQFYQGKRDLLIKSLASSRLKIIPSEGTYFLLVDYSEISTLDDLSFCEYLAKEIGVAAIPLSVFYQQGSSDRVIRLCFAKEDSTLKLAAEKLCQL